jgi:hypothetical protein
MAIRNNQANLSPFEPKRLCMLEAFGDFIFSENEHLLLWVIDLE